ncbi:MAG: MoaD/ThiS family protein [Desulfovibrio sp.]
MPIEIKCYATLADRAPADAAAFPVAPGETLLDVLTRLSIAEEDVKIVFVNGVISPLDRPLVDGDRVGVFPAVGGG